MVIWLNGAFGVGKTSVARELLPLLPSARLVDPERLGYVMRRTFWRGRDYQDVASWRRLTRRQVERAGRRGIAVVPMTVVDARVLDEVVGGLHGVRVLLLAARRDVLEARIVASDEARDWRLAQLDRCLGAFAAGGFGEPVATDGRTPSELAQEIAALV